MLLARVAARQVLQAARPQHNAVVIPSRGFARLRLRQRSGDMHMLYMAAFVGVGSGWYIFAPLMQESAGASDAADASSAESQPPAPVTR